MGGKRTLGLGPLDNGLVVFRGVGLRDTALSAASLGRRVRRAFNHPGWVNIRVGNAGDFANKSAKHQQVTVAFCEGSPRIRNSIPVCELFDCWAADVRLLSAASEGDERQDDRDLHAAS
jgi:hypothetical protein